MVILWCRFGEDEGFVDRLLELWKLLDAESMRSQAPPEERLLDELLGIMSADAEYSARKQVSLLMFSNVFCQLLGIPSADVK